MAKTLSVVWMKYERIHAVTSVSFFDTSIVQPVVLTVPDEHVDINPP